MFLTKKATSVIEAMVVLLIVTTGVVGMFLVFGNSQKLASSTSNKIQAISIAREGIEAMKNIRDTNWILFASDNANCWNVDNYNNKCVGATASTNPNYLQTDIKAESYKIFQKADKRWYLSEKITSKTKFTEEDYKNEMKVGLDPNGFFTQSGAVTEIKTLFTREIQISYPDGDSNNSRMQIKSIVKWTDLASDRPHKVEFTSILTNWKK